MRIQLLRFGLMQHIVRWVCCALLGIQLLSGAQLVESGLERAQFYAGTCLSIDTNCTVGDQRVSLGESPSHIFNLAIHLSGLLSLQTLAEPAKAQAPQVATVELIPQWLFATRIDHPPKA